LLWQAIGNAYAILSNPEKKRQYDLYGDEEVAPRSRYGQYLSPSLALFHAELWIRIQ
jgi:DnaJ-class molecular chaperone